MVFLCGEEGRNRKTDTGRNITVLSIYHDPSCPSRLDYVASLKAQNGVEDLYRDDLPPMEDHSFIQPSFTGASS